MSDVLMFASDYMEGAHEKIINKLVETNLEKTVGYGMDEYSISAKEKIRKACNAPDADVFFLVGGTQTNAAVITTMLKQYQGVIACDTGHVEVHEAGAIEYNGHKVLTVKGENGKLKADTVRTYVEKFYDDDNHEHMVMPGMVYVSQPTETGTLYSLAELESLKTVCKEFDMYLYVDGARLAYALGCKENDVTLPDLANLADAFYIGGTKCGALFGEAVVFPKKDTVPHFYTMIKQFGAMLAKGRILGIQYDTLFTDDLYLEIGKKAVDLSNRIREALIEKGYKFAFDTPTNQIFILLGSDKCEELSKKVRMDFFEANENGERVMRICTSWATREEDVDKLIRVL